MKITTRQRGEGEIIVLLLGAGIAYFLITAGVHLWLLVSTFPSSEQISAQSRVAREFRIPLTQYITNTCKLKAVCRRYEKVRAECATAGSIKGCIHIKMEGDDYSACEGGSLFEETPGQPSILPTHEQCTANKIRSFFGENNSQSESPPQNTSNAGRQNQSPQILQPNEGSSTPSSDQ